jgi:hypothetical protein
LVTPESPSSIAGVGDGDHRGQGQRAVATALSPTIGAHVADVSWS